MKHFYQLFAEGDMALFGRKYKFHSGTIYSTKEEALANMDDFINKCTTCQDDYDLTYLENVTRNGVIELTLAN